MPDLRLADEVLKAAEYMSKHENMSVEVSAADGSRTFYFDGKDIPTPQGAVPMPQWNSGESVTYLDLTPTQVRTGHWLVGPQSFVASRTMSPQEFVSIYKLAKSSGE